MFLEMNVFLSSGEGKETLNSVGTLKKSYQSLDLDLG
jgi:hypothetical protein